MERTFSITTLGCKLNQYESECIRQTLVKNGWVFREQGQAASIIIVNTCTVTGRSDSRCRNAIRRARRASPDSIILATGCYAEIQPEALKSMPETDMIIGNDEKGSIPGLMEELSAGRAGDDLRLCVSTPIEPAVGVFLDRSRALMKIQEGCDASCSYCVIPRARGASRSVDPGAILSQVSELERNGCEEIVLTGIHIGRYGGDLAARVTLESLLREILLETRVLRVRLSSIEVNEVTDGMIRMAADSGRVAPHFHIPLQSGHDDILRAMNRPYTTELFREKLLSIKKASPDIAVGTDIIVGFPGETEDHFNSSARFLKSVPVDYFHVFPFSARPGTAAESLPGQISPEVKKARCRRLINLGKSRRREFMMSQAGRVSLALIQGKTKKHSRFSTGLTGNYCEVSLPADSGLQGRLEQIEILRYSRGRLYGRLVT